MVSGIQIRTVDKHDSVKRSIKGSLGGHEGVFEY